MMTSRVSLVIPRLDAKPWGGRKLERYGLELPAGTSIGEALVTAGEARIAAGDGAESTLGELVAAGSRERLGELALAAVGGRAVFPLLVKLIDAAENLSIQVHPDDEGAANLDRLGKTEAWHVLAAEPGAKLYIGLRDDVGLDAFMTDARRLDGSSARSLRSVDAVPGMTVLIPAGTIHALGAGVMVYEIQQPSDITFRLDDWGRVDAAGNPREMHLEQGHKAAREAYRPVETRPIAIGTEPVSRLLLTACRYFALERLHVPSGTGVSFVNGRSPEVITALSGVAEVSAGQDRLRLEPGASIVIWPGDAPVSLEPEGDCDLLRAWVPDLMQDIVIPARTSGADDETIAALGGETDDLRRILATA
ncbi:MAG TPA: type I phosphomannose isomerase catalytic subunit [Thermomicrobiales bacterium]|nr:type I phosphomannose isomerase catalytic subunit [Thermomicrobiales bacterium]